MLKKPFVRGVVLGFVLGVISVFSFPAITLLMHDNSTEATYICYEEGESTPIPLKDIFKE